MEITAFVPEQLDKLDLAPQPFPIVGKFDPVLSKGEWSYEETLFPQASGTKTNPPMTQDDLEFYAKGGDRVLFLAKEKDVCLGYIAIEQTHVGCAYVDHLEVFAESRGKGVGTALMQRAVLWARERNLTGMCLETQADNLVACRFYLKHGFQLGGANTLRYHMLPAPKNKETAIFFYLLF